VRYGKALTWSITFFLLGMLLFHTHSKVAFLATMPAVNITGPGINSQSGTNPYGVFGFQVQPNVDILVTQQGMFDMSGDGFSNTHPVGLWSDIGFDRHFSYINFCRGGDFNGRSFS